MIHFLYNLLGVILIYGSTFLRDLPIKCAETLAAVASERKVLAFAYIVTVFFLMPAILVGISQIF